ncbi:MAG: SET domain-containing protein, partial [Spirochaetia bacterium]|nr:SET domain-containing protein [Spirochaetia bacterium]
MENQNENQVGTLTLPPEELIALKKSEIHGNGIVALRDIPKGTVIIEYTGTLRTHTEVDGGPEDEEDTGHTFLFTLND